MNAYQSLLSRIRMVRRRWRIQRMAKGIALFLGSAVALFILGIWGADLFGFRPAAVWAMRLITGGAACCIAVRFFVTPLRRTITDTQIAQYVEERYPNLEDRLVTAVEYGDSQSISPGMLDLLIRDAMEKTNRLDFSVFLNRRRLFAYGAAGLGTFLLLVALLNWGPPFFRYGFDRLYIQWTQAAPRSVFLIEVAPGDVQIAKGLDQQVMAQLVGFDAVDVKLYTQAENSPSWTPVSMEPDPFGSSFLYLLVEVQSSLRYYVEARDVRSKTYTINVVNAPRVDKIDLTYRFPAYTGMAVQKVEGEGDISAIKGTRVELNLHTNQPVQSARLLFDDQSTLPLAAAGDTSFSGAFSLKRSGSYVVQLADARGGQYAGSPEYVMEALGDAPPKVTVTRPMRDVRATSVEEVFSETKAEDDIGLSKLELHFSVNGGAEKVVGLYAGSTAEKSVVGTHTFFLEDFGLQPGDMIAYYGKAFDNNTTTGPGTSASDIYFIQVRPFEQRYTQSQQAGGGGGGGGSGEGGGQQELIQQQKDVISATFKLIRDKDVLDPKEYQENLKSLSLIEGKLQTQTQTLVERLVRRGALEVSKEFAQLGEYMKNAAEEMGKAAIHLGEEKPVEALPEEQRALQQLLRAESIFREIQISFQNQGGGGGSQSGSGSRAEDLADLFELEMNKLKNQYETVQRGEQQARDQKIDELMERLKELARRQQQLNERNRLMGRPPGSSVASGSAGQNQQQGNQAAGARGNSASSSGSSARSQQQLLDEAEQLQRQLQRLSRERSSQELNQASNQLQQSIQQMKQALQQQQRGEQQAAAQGTRALQQLQDAMRSLARSQENSLGQGLERAVQESRAVLNEQNRIRSGIDKLIQDRQQAGSEESKRQIEDLTGRKSALADRVQNLQGQIEDLARLARKTQPEANGKLNQAAGAIRERQLPDRIRSGNQLLQGGYYDFIAGREDLIRAGLEEANKQLEAARNGLGQTQQGRLEDALNRTRQLAEGLQSVQQRLQGQQGQQGQRSQSDGRNRPDSSGAPPYGNVGEMSGDATPPKGGARYSQEELRQRERELAQRAQDAQALRRLLDRSSSEAQSLDQVIQALQRLRSVRRYDNPDGIAYLKQAIDLLHRVELELSRDLARVAQNDKYLYAEDSEVPSNYKKLVEEYYKSLAKGKR